MTVKITAVTAGPDTVIRLGGVTDRSRLGVAFHPFSLDPGKTRYLIIASPLPICAQEPGGWRTPGTLGVQFDVFGIDREASVGEISEPRFSLHERCVAPAGTP